MKVFESFNSEWFNGEYDERHNLTYLPIFLNFTNNSCTPLRINPKPEQLPVKIEHYGK